MTVYLYLVLTIFHKEEAMTKKKTLVEILEEDKVGNWFNQIEKAGKKLDQKIRTEMQERFPTVVLADERYEADDFLQKTVDACDFETEEGLLRASQLLEVNLEDLKGYIELEDRLGGTLIPFWETEIEPFKEDWPKQLEGTNITLVSEIPKSTSMPCIVFHSPEWCFWCWIIKPTFIEVANHFDKIPIFINDNSDASQTVNVNSYPRLAVHFPPNDDCPEGKIITVYPGTSAQEIWDNLNALISLGETFQGTSGKLVCDENGCHIEA